MDLSKTDLVAAYRHKYIKYNLVAAYRHKYIKYKSKYLQQSAGKRGSRNRSRSRERSRSRKRSKKRSRSKNKRVKLSLEDDGTRVYICGEASRKIRNDLKKLVSAVWINSRKCWRVNSGRYIRLTQLLKRKNIKFNSLP
jgi:hypothetical protein